MIEPPTFRAATPADAERLASAVVFGLDDYRSFAPEGWEPPAVEAEAEHLIALLPDQRVWCLIAELGGRIVGQVTLLPAALGPRAVEDRRLAHLSNLFVDRELWGSGLATALHAAAVAAARERGFGALRLFCAAGQRRARRFYEREGWIVVSDEFFDPQPSLVLVEYRLAV